MAITPSPWPWVQVDPSADGLAGGLGQIVSSPTGLWIKTGDAATDWETFTGEDGGLATVVTDDTLTGDGSAENPLHVARLLAAARVVATFNITLEDEQDIDGVTVEDGDRVLCTGQTDAAENGMWLVVDGGEWTRPEDYDADEDLAQGQLAPVLEGTLYAGSVWSLTTATPTIAGDKDFASSVQTCVTDAWGEMFANFVKTKEPTLVKMAFRSKFATAFTQEIERGALSGTGASASILLTKNGGAMRLDTGTTGNSFRIVRNVNGMGSAGAKSDLVFSGRTQKCAIGLRVQIGTVGAGATMNLLCIGDEATADGAAILAVKGATSTANWTWLIGAAAAVDTGAALPTASPRNICIILGGTTVRAWNMDTGVEIGTAQLQSAIGAVAIHPFMNALNTAAASNTCDLSEWGCLTEMAA